MSCFCRRWYFDVAKWNPKPEEWLLAVQLIQLEELRRAGKFLFKVDAKAAVIGRLMLRQAIHQITGIRWQDLQLHRTPKGKPFLFTPNSLKVPQFSVNISHQGDFVVLGSSCSSAVGVDVMRIRTPNNHSPAGYVKLMKKQFSPREYRALHLAPTDADRMKLFYRYWCLKESIIKALGIGIHNDLASLDFLAGQPLEPEDIVGDSEITFRSPGEASTATVAVTTSAVPSAVSKSEGSLKSGKSAKASAESEATKPEELPVKKEDNILEVEHKQPDETWYFEESLISNHILTVCVNRDTLPQACTLQRPLRNGYLMSEFAFQPITFRQLIAESYALHCPLRKEWHNLCSKREEKDW